MADPTYPETGDIPDLGTNQRSAPTGMPRWVKAFVVAILALVLLFVVLKFTGIGGDHGPGRHGGGDDQEQDGGGHDPSDWDH
jgi:hypothetical protein